MYYVSLTLLCVAPELVMLYIYNLLVKTMEWITSFVI